MKAYTGNFDVIRLKLLKGFEYADRVESHRWQGQDVQHKPQSVTWEQREVVFATAIPETMSGAAKLTQCNYHWAEAHFQERVGGKPLNPPPSNEIWPYKVDGHKDHVDEDGLFSHTYPERFWPKYAGGAELPRRGVRYDYGDLQDILNLLKRDPYTRQAYLPIWAQEDTGAISGQRVPCSLGYLLMRRGNKLHLTYHIRSCDFFRHFQDDVYMAMRLAQYVREAVWPRGVEMGELTMHISSLHCFDADIPRVKRLIEEATGRVSQGVLGALG